MNPDDLKTFQEAMRLRIQTENILRSINFYYHRGEFIRVTHKQGCPAFDTLQFIDCICMPQIENVDEQTYREGRKF